MPTPNKGEKRADFISRCVSDLHAEKGRWKSNDQIVAVCHSLWEQHEKGKEKEGKDRE